MSIRYYINVWRLRVGADKSLARPRRKQATATKLGIYSTYSPRSSIRFLARCSIFCKSLKKKNQKLVRSTRSPRLQWLPRRTKNGKLSILFSVQGTVGSPTGPDPENRVGDQENGSLGRPVSSGVQVPVSRGIVVRQDKFHEIPAKIFLQNVLQLHQQKWVILRVDSWALWKIINVKNAVLIQKIGARTYPADFCTRIFLGRGESLCRHSIDCCFVSASQWYNQVSSMSPIASASKSFGSRRKNSKSC